jgi:hypothetical protein
MPGCQFDVELVDISALQQFFRHVTPSKFGFASVPWTAKTGRAA